MLKWLLTVFVVLVALAALSARLERMGWGRLPGDLRFAWRGRAVHVPFTSTVLLSLGVYLLARFI